MDKLSEQQNHCAFGTESLKMPGTADLRFCAIFFLSAFLLGSCGIEEYPYLEPIGQDSIVRELNVRAEIPLPNISSSLFTHFAIYYRVYISGESIVGQILEDDMSRVNAALAQDYRNVLPYTAASTSTSGSTQIGTVFANLKYYSLYTQSVNLDNLLSNSAMGRSITIDFAPVNGRRPTISIGDGMEYVLFRTTGSERPGEARFDIRPDGNRSFINTSDINSSANASSANVNNDVVDNAYASVSGPRYTYVSMYIVASGHDNVTYSPIYSQPTHIGVFRLPEP
jgi:hypothetical protein